MYHLELDNFQGPFDLLYQLLEKNKLDISKVSLAEIAEQYLEYVRQMQVLDLEMASEFLLMAVKLLELKTRSLLPSRNGADQEENESRAEELVQKVLEYRRFKEIAGDLREKEEARSGIFSREQEQIIKVLPVDELELDPLEGVALDDLAAAFDRALARMRELEKQQKREELQMYRWEMYNVQDKMKEIGQLVKASPAGFDFTHLFSQMPNRVELVVTFLALLEMIKQKQIKVVQAKPFQDIRVQPL